MAADGFFSRWSKRKTEATQQTLQKPNPSAALVEPTAEKPPSPDAIKPRDAERSEPAGRGANAADNHQAKAAPQPTLEDVARLTPDSDFSAFVARGVDETIKRQALKKLFSDPHFNVMDGLDIYIDDYNKFEPISPQMLASLEHAKSTLNPLAQLEKPLMRLTQENTDAAAASAADAPAPAEAGTSETDMPAAEAADDTHAPSARTGQPAGAPGTPDGSNAPDGAASIDKTSDDPSNDHTV